MRRLLKLFQSHLSYKIILPYLALTVLVMMAGAAIAVGLVAASWEERLQSQLAQVARNTTDALVRRERNQLDYLLLIASAPRNQDIPAVADAFASGDTQDVIRALTPYYGLGVTNLNLDLDRMIAFDNDGKVFVDWQRIGEDPTTPPVVIQGTDFSQVDVVKRVTSGELVNGDDKFANLIYFLPDNQPYFYTVAPIKQGTTVVGGVMIAIKLDRLLASLEKSSQSSVTTFYDLNGDPIGTTLIPRTELASLRISEQALRPLLNGEAQSIFTVDIRQRGYRLAYSPLVIADEQVGYFSVGLSNDFQVRSLSLSRNAIIAIAMVLAVGTIVLGYVIARSITQPLTSLVSTAEAVTAGDLERRTEIRSIDEFGRLAQAFNQMTEHLLRLYRASRDLNNSIEIDPVLEVTARTVQSFVPGSEALAMLDERGDGILRYRLHSSAAPTTLALQNLRISAFDPLLQGLGEHRTTVLLSPAQEPRLEATGLWSVAGFNSVLMAPLVVQDKLTGVLIFGHTSADAFGGALEPTLTAIANMAASVLYNAVLFDQVQDESSQRRAILESIADGVVVCDRQRTVMLVNHAAEQMLDMHDWNLVRRNFNEVPLKRVEAAQDMFGSDTGELEHYRLGERVMRMSHAPVIGDNGEELGEVIVLHDISAEAAVDQAKTTFIATISHELRSPLTVISGNTELLLRGLVGELSADQRDLLESVRNRVDVINRIVKNMILVASIESNTLDTELEPHELWVAVDQAISAVRLSYTKKNLGIEANIPKDLVPVLADREQLQLILGQLLDNARRYTKEGVVTIGAERHDGFIHINVTDTGPGIPVEQHGRLFTRFHRVEGNNSPERGSGLGLVITRQLVERQGGRVWASSEVGSGSTFSFSLPIAHEHTNILADQNQANATA